MEGMQNNTIQAGGYGPPGGGGYGGPPPGGAPPGGFGPPPGGAPPGGFGPPPGGPGGFGPPGGMPPAGGYGAPPPGFGAPGGFPPPGGPMMPGAGGDVNTTLSIVLSIVALFFCCPAGIVAIVFAVQANSAKNAGDIEGARNKAKTSLIIAGISIALGIISAIGNVLAH